MPRFIPKTNMDINQGGIHRLRTGVPLEYPEGHPMTARLRQISPMYLAEEKPIPVAAKPDPTPSKPKFSKSKISKKATRKKG